MVELFDRHEMKYTLVGIDEVIYPGINLYVGKLASGLELIEEKVVILTAHELFGEVNVSKTKYFRFKDAKTLRNFQELNVGDYVVHDTHGIDFLEYDISFKGICPRCREKMKEEQNG